MDIAKKNWVKLFELGEVRYTLEWPVFLSGLSNRYEVPSQLWQIMMTDQVGEI